MLSIARWMMRGLPYAAGGAAIAGLVPWLFWMSAAIAGLVTLRQGMASALPVILAAGLPAGWWWVQGDVIPLATLLLVTLMGVVLRERLRWSEALISGSLAGAAMVQLGVFLPPGGSQALLDQLRESSPEAQRILEDLTQQGISTEALATLVVGGVSGIIVLLLAVACLALARGWQAGLYNPGGFREEFHSFRLAPRELVTLVVLGILGSLLALPGLAILAWVPLLIAGIALIHGIIGLKGMKGLWLVIFYVLLITTWPTILIVLLLALIDTFADFRTRLARSV
ncbi:hypothetical protein SAMN05216571_102290 [Onishia taeanensis]|jgi:hypothetical protein|uniref:Uncharacterized protein n=1 Tax=Onishia taeanensis TaxID=284577 RepID=A0A1G7PF17_9GAMM|nr:hypothetical protein [Halomonas taeanensis]MAX34018.1 hypothetical protein [Halomonadaceae bacterium]SDF84861.1 hypothetical protein SAMN05216571_102290 [Halomonas taeanensis]|tara:strand:- start:26174 stop:27025 length:852 start_codon:yes stop_codon:yes gene_type:complete